MIGDDNLPNGREYLIMKLWWTHCKIGVKCELPRALAQGIETSISGVLTPNCVFAG